MTPVKVEVGLELTYLLEIFPKESHNYLEEMELAMRLMELSPVTITAISETPIIW